MIYRVGRCDVANFVENEVFVFHQGGILHQENSEQITTMMVLILKFERVLR